MGRVLGINDQSTYKLAFKLDSSPAIAKPSPTRDRWIPLDIESLLSLERAGIRPHVPDLFYDVEEYNRISFLVLRYLREAFDECAALLAGRGESKYLNLVGIFFHELQRILCAYVFKICELEHLSRDLGVERKIGSSAGIPHSETAGILSAGPMIAQGPR